MRPPAGLLTDAALAQRREEILRALGVLEAQLERVTDALCAREPHGRHLPAGVHHGTRAGYRADCHCTACCEANARFQAQARERRRARLADQRAHQSEHPPRERSTTMPNHPKIAQPTIRYTHRPGRTVWAKCDHCPWSVGPVTLATARERAAVHRENHHAGVIAVTRGKVACRG